MPRVICELENASELINNVRFAADRGQMVSEEVDEATAAAFCAIPGYRLLEMPPATEASPQQPAGKQGGRQGGKAAEKTAGTAPAGDGGTPPAS